MRRALCLFVLAACSPAGSSAPRSRLSESDASVNDDDAGTADSGGLRVCMHDAKDLAPCAEDCDRRIGYACGVLASRQEHDLQYPAAVRNYERACELQDAASCVSAAHMIAAGHGVPPSRSRQVELLARACNLGDALACALPARAYANGSGVPRDERRAAELWERACGSGDERACEEIDAGSP